MGFGEMMLLFLMAFLLLGPKKTPELARQLAQTIAKIKGTVSDLQANLTLESVDMPPEAIPDPVIEAQRQSIVGVVPASIKAPTVDAAEANGEPGGISVAAAPPKAGPSQTSEEIYV